MKLPKGTTGVLKEYGMCIPVEVHEITSSYGRVRYLVSAIGGSGRVKKEKIALDKEFQYLLEAL